MGLISGTWHGGNLLANDGGPGPKKPPGKPPGVGNRGRGGRGRGRGQCRNYLLKATFTSSLAAECGTLITNELDGSFAQSGGVVQVTAPTTPSWGDLTMSSGDTGGAGYPYKITVNGSALESTGLTIGFVGDSGQQYSTLWLNSGDIAFHYEEVERSSLVVGTVSNSTDEDFVFIRGGYDASRIPMASASDIASYNYGTAYFRYESSNWKLLYKTYHQQDSDHQRAAASIYDYGGTLDELLVPNQTYADVLEPIVLDLFTDTNGTALASHSPDVDTEAGGWSALLGTPEIQSNKLTTDTPSTLGYGYIEAGTSDVVMYATVNFSASSPTKAGAFVCRVVDSDNYWLLQITAPQTGKEVTIYDKTGGSFTLRASTDDALNLNTDYPVIAISDDEEMRLIFRHYTTISYASATVHKTATKHGAGTNDTAAAVDNFAIFARGTGGEYSSLNNI